MRRAVVSCIVAAWVGAAVAADPLAAVTGVPGLVAFWDFAKRESAGQRRFSAHVPADSPPEVLDKAWRCFAMTLDHEKAELTGWLDGVAGDRWLADHRHDRLLSSAYEASMQGHFARTPDREPADATAIKSRSEWLLQLGRRAYTARRVIGLIPAS